MGKPKIIDAFFKKKHMAHSEVNTPLAMNSDDTMTDNRPIKSLRIEPVKDCCQA